MSFISENEFFSIQSAKRLLFYDTYTLILKIVSTGRANLELRDYVLSFFSLLPIYIIVCTCVFREIHVRAGLLFFFFFFNFIYCLSFINRVSIEYILQMCIAFCITLFFIYS